MKVLMFGWEFPPLISGGLGTACYGMTRGLAESGEEIIFVLPKAPEAVRREGFQLLSAADVRTATASDSFPLPAGVSVWAVSSSLLPYTHETEYQGLLEKIDDLHIPCTQEQSIISLSGHYAKNLFEEVQRFAEIGWRMGARPEFDLIHAHDWMTFPAAIAAKTRSQRPFIAHVHATEYDRTGDNPNLEIVRFERMGLEAADRIVAVSHRTKYTLQQRYGIPAEKIDVVHNGIETQRLVDPSQIKKGFNEKLIIFVGRVTLQKGPEYFLRAAARVLATHPHFRFVMCGAGDMLPRMIEEAAALRIQNRFHFTGFLRGAALDTLYSMADLFVMSSVSEPFGLTPFEAMRYQVPVIVSKQTGAAELLSQQVQVDFWDLHQMAERMIEFCEDETLRSQFISQQSSTLQHMSWRRVAHQLMGIYRKVAVS